MALPKQVRQQIEEAKRIQTEIKAAAETPADPAPAPAPVPAETPVAADPAAAAPDPTPVPAPQPQLDAQYAELLQQYRSLQGIHRTLVRSNSELQSKAQGLQERVTELTTQVEKLNQKLSTAPTSNVAPITDEEVKEFGPDLISVIERKAREVAAPLNERLAKVSEEAEALKRRNAELEQSMAGISTAQAEDAQARFQRNLLQLVPDFDTLNFDKNFLSWLSQVDPLDARKRTLQDRLNEAVELGDAQAVASFFNAFRQVPKAPPAQKTDLAAQAQPASRSAPDTSTVQAGKKWTGDEINAFYADVARDGTMPVHLRKYSPQEKARIEKEIFAAQKDNRIAA